jgi:hypothetical protein
MGPLYSNNQDACPCVLENVGTPFTCGGSTGRTSARICGSMYQLVYDANRPNMCCRLKFI